MATLVENSTLQVFPIEFDDFFTKNNVVFKQISDKYRTIKQSVYPDKIIKSTKQLIDYMEKEMIFWDYPERNNNPLINSYKDWYKQALTSIIEASNTYNTNKDIGLRKFKESVSLIVSRCHISSSTKIAKLFKTLKDKSSYFFYGFDCALSLSNSNVHYSNPSWIEGFFHGLEYKKLISSIERIVEQHSQSFIDAIHDSERSINKIIENATALYHEQEGNLKNVVENTNKDLILYKQQYDNYVQEKETRILELEKTYEEKLRLSKPAEYWSKLEKSYKKSGIIWLIISSLIALITIFGLIFIIIFTPNLFEENAYWLDMLKDTALLTVITSIAIYILRITIKLSMSSFHLSRDAKEREQLSYFYLSLMNNQGVTEKERALILNALFSRSDTGLLKGESAPSMSANITELIDKDKSK